MFPQVTYHGQSMSLGTALGIHRDEVAELASSWHPEMRRIVVHLMDAMAAAGEPPSFRAVERAIEAFAQYEVPKSEYLSSADTFIPQWDWAVEHIHHFIHSLKPSETIALES